MSDRAVLDTWFFVTAGGADRRKGRRYRRLGRHNVRRSNVRITTGYRPFLAGEDLSTDLLPVLREKIFEKSLVSRGYTNVRGRRTRCTLTVYPRATSVDRRRRLRRKNQVSS